MKSAEPIGTFGCHVVLPSMSKRLRKESHKLQTVQNIHTTLVELTTAAHSEHVTCCDCSRDVL